MEIVLKKFGKNEKSPECVFTFRAFSFKISVKIPKPRGAPQGRREYY